MDGMDPELYGDTPKEGSKPESIDEEEAEHPASLVDIKVLTGKDGVKPKVGEERVVKIMAIHGDQAEIEYAPEKPDEEAGETKPDAEPDEMDQLNKEY